MQAQINETPNDTCAVLMLSIGESRIVFSGDAPLNAWKKIKDDKQILPLNVDIASVPHHGGSLGGTEEEERLFYSDMLCPKSGIVSLASHNSHKHPRIQSIRNLIESGINVLCTQMTEQCTDISSWNDNPSRFCPPKLSRSHKSGLQRRSGSGGGR